MTIRRAFGTLSPVIFFRCADEHVVLAPYSDFPTPLGCEYQIPIVARRCGKPCERDGADSLAAIDRLQAKLTKQENDKLALERHFDVMQTQAGRDRVQDNLYARMISSETPELEKEFIREYLKLRPELRGKHHAKFAEYSVYIRAREFDLGKRGADEERNPT